MVKIIEGNLLESDVDVIGHQSNCMKGYGSGIAGQIRRLFPYAYEVFANDNRTQQQKLGSYCVSKVHDPYYIFNLYGQMNYGGDGKQYTDYIALEKAIRGMVEQVIYWERNTGHFKIGLPYLIGCGLAGGKWEVVEEMIETISEDMKHDIYLYKFTP